MRRARVAAFAPDITVVTTAPSYLFWRCAPPELRVPQEIVARLAERRRHIVAVGPHASTTPARRCASSAPTSRCSASARRSCRSSRRAARRGRHRVALPWRDGESQVQGGTARDRYGDAAGARTGRDADDRAPPPSPSSLRCAAGRARAPRWRRRAAARITARSARRTTSATATASGRSP